MKSNTFTTKKNINSFQADLFAGSIFLTQAIPGMNLYVAVVILLAISAIFTIGGMNAVKYYPFYCDMIRIHLLSILSWHDKNLFIGGCQWELIENEYVNSRTKQVGKTIGVFGSIFWNIWNRFLKKKGHYRSH